MSAGALVDELTAAGVRLSLAGETSATRPTPGVSIAPYREPIIMNKPTLIALLRLQDEIVAAASTARDAFDRQHYDQLWVAWHTRQKEMTH